MIFHFSLLVSKTSIFVIYFHFLAVILFFKYFLGLFIWIGRFYAYFLKLRSKIQIVIDILSMVDKMVVDDLEVILVDSDEVQTLLDVLQVTIMEDIGVEFVLHEMLDLLVHVYLFKQLFYDVISGVVIYLAIIGV